MSIINLGSMNLDHVYTVGHFVQPGETLPTLEMHDYFGGKGLNQSIAVAKSGTPIFHAGMSGCGSEAVIAWLEKNGVNCSLLGHCHEPQGHTVIQVDAHGQNCILLFGGSNQCVSRAYITQVLDQFQAGDWLMLQNEISQVAFAVEYGYSRGMKVVLNASPLDDALKEANLSHLSWLIVNELECCGLAGVEDPLEALAQLRKAYPDTGILLTLGSEGSIAVQGEKIHREPARKVVPVDTTGAGDTYAGYFVGSLAAGKTLAESMGTATAAAAISISRPGASTSIPTVEEVLSVLEAGGAET